MLFCFYTNIVSPHQLPFARELVKRVGAENYRYVYSEPFHAERRAMGWTSEQEPWILSETERRDEARRWLEESDVLILGHRDWDLVERRCQKGLRTFYASERWFKPIPLRGRSVTGWVRLLVPSYWRMTRRFVSLVRKYDGFRLLPYGVWAERDFRLMGVPAEKMTTWGYAVAPSERRSSEFGVQSLERGAGDPLRVLWVGRMLDLKRVDTIIRAVALANEACQVKVKKSDEQRRFTLTLVGDGPEKPRLQRLANQLQKKSKAFTAHLDTSPFISFRPSCPIDEVRSLMRQHDVYVFASNALDGWGAVVGEALEEGMLCLGSREAGASATLLPSACQFASGDARGLARLLMRVYDGELPRAEIAGWSAADLAERFLEKV